MTQEYSLGIDGGGSKTLAALLGPDGEVVARAVSGPSNHHTAGQPQAEAALRQVIEQVLSAAGLRMTDLSAVCLGMAGVGRPEDREVVDAIVDRALGYPASAPSTAPQPRVLITHDAECALVGGVGRRYGVVLTAGTGAMAYGVNARGESHRADGWGYLLGDEGSAYWIGHQALCAMVRAYDGRGASTATEALLLHELGLSRTTALVQKVYSAGFGVRQIAALSPLVSRAADGGDAVAQGILQEAGRRLGNTAGAVVRALRMDAATFEVVLAGGVLRASGRVREAVMAVLRETAPGAHPIAPRDDAAVGAALLARQIGE